MTKSSNKGFTLIELLVVIAIIGLLSTLAVVALNSARAKSRDSKRVADIKQIQTALELYFADNNSYPSMGTGTPAATILGVAGTGGTKVLCGSGVFSDTCSGTTYMGLVPLAPTPVDGTCTTGTGGTNHYTYTSSAASGSTSATYTLTFCLGAQVGDLGAGPHTASQNGIQ